MILFIIRHKVTPLLILVLDTVTVYKVVELCVELLIGCSCCWRWRCRSRVPMTAATDNGTSKLHSLYLNTDKR